MAPPNNSSFSVKAVLPASGWEMMAKVLLLLISSANTANWPLDMSFVPGLNGSSHKMLCVRLPWGAVCAADYCNTSMYGARGPGGRDFILLPAAALAAEPQHPRGPPLPDSTRAARPLA